MNVITEQLFNILRADKSEHSRKQKQKIVRSGSPCPIAEAAQLHCKRMKTDCSLLKRKFCLYLLKVTLVEQRDLTVLSHCALVSV